MEPRWRAKREINKNRGRRSERQMDVEERGSDQGRIIGWRRVRGRQRKKGG